MRYRTKVLFLAMFAGIIGCCAAMLFLALRAPAPWTLDVGAPGDAYYLADSFLPEVGDSTTLRWTRDTTQLLLHGAPAAASALDLRLYRGDTTPAQPWPVRLARDAGALAVFSATPGWRVYRLLLPPGAALNRAGNAAPLTLAGPTFQPGTQDPRDLGVALDWLRVEALPGPLAAGPPLVRALWLAGCLGALFVLLGYRLSAIGYARVAPLLLLALAAAGLAGWAWRSPQSLGWALPTSWWPALGFVVLATIGAAGRWQVAARNTQYAIRNTQYAIFALAHLALLPALPLAVRGLAAWAILLLPGALAARLIFHEERDGLTQVFLALCGGLALLPPLLLALHALPGPLPWWLLLLVVDGLSLLLWWRQEAGGRRQEAGGRSQEPGARSQETGRPSLAMYGWTVPPDPVTRSPGHPVTRSPVFRLLSPLFALLVLAAALRLPLLGSAEFQGDEAYALLLAKGVRHGQEDILLLHMKGPVEALLPAAPLALLGRVSEWIARLPFALAGMAVLLGAFVLARALFGGGAPGRSGVSVGLVAVLLLALDGFLIAFARIVQYQSIVMLLALGALWCCWRFYENREPRTENREPRTAGRFSVLGSRFSERYLLGAAFFAAVAVLAHYDGVLVAPACAWLVVAGGRGRGWRGVQWLRALAAPVALGLTLTLSFYLPFVTHEHFARTAEYLEARTGQEGLGSALHNSLGGYFQLATFYNTIYVVVALAAILLAALLVWIVANVRPRALGVGLAGWLLLAAAVEVVAPAVLDLPGGGSWAVLAFAPPLLALVLAPAVPAPLRALLIWFAAPFLAMAFLVGDPRTHFYTMHVPAALLIAFALTSAAYKMQVAKIALVRPVCYLLPSAFGLLAVPYAALLFLRQQPEYQRSFPAALVELYRPATGERLPDEGFFGFPHRDGWKVVGELYRRGVIQGSYDSNQKLFISGWYSRGAYKCPVLPDYFFTALNVAPLYIPPGYHHFGSVVVDGARALEIYRSAPVDGPPQLFDAAAFRDEFDEQPVENFPIRRLLSGVAPQQRLAARWQGGAALRGYDLDHPTLGPGGVAALTLYWRSDAAIEPGYEPVVEIRAQDGALAGLATPYCGGMPPEAWHAAYVNDTPFRIVAGEGLPPGQYTLRVGIRHPRSGAWLPRADGSETLPFASLVVR